MNILYLIISFVILIVGLWYFGKHKATLNVFLLFYVFAFLYCAAIPIENILSPGNSFDNPFKYTAKAFEKSLIMFFLGTIGFSLGLVFMRLRIKIIPTVVEKKVRGLLSISVVSFMSLILLLVCYRSEVLISIDSYIGNYSSTYNNPIYAYLKETLFFSLSILISILFLMKERKWIVSGIVVSLILSLFGFLTRDKDPLLLSVIPYLFLAAPIYNRIKINRIVKGVAVFTLVVIVLPIISLQYSLYRGNDPRTLSQALTNEGIYTFFDARGPYQSIGLELMNERSSFYYGKTYLDGFTYWIPRFVWPQRSMGPAEEFAKQHMKDWKPGMGLGYSPIAEAYSNFGILGAFFHFLLYSIVIGLLFKLTKKLFVNSSEEFITALFFVWLVYNLVMMFRGGFSLPSTYIRYILPFFFAYLFFDKYKIHLFVWNKLQRILK